LPLLLVDTLPSVRPMPMIRKLFPQPRHFQIALLALLTAMLATGCTFFKKDSAPAPVPPAGIRENGVLRLTKADNNRTADVRVGETLQVSLPENRGTGHAWAIDETSSRLLALDSTQYTEPTEGFIGARGQRIFTFTARQPGEIGLKLKYWRFSEGDSSITERYGVTIRIGP